MGGSSVKEEKTKEEKGKGYFIFLGLGIIMGLLIGFTGVNYDNNSYLEKENYELKSQLWGVQLKLYDLSNELQYWTMLHDYYYDSTIVALNSADDDLAQTLSEELFALEGSLENLKQKHNSLVTLLGKLSSKTNANAELINAVKNQVEENAQAIVELSKKHDALRNTLYTHTSQKRGLFKKPHDENVKRELETN